MESFIRVDKETKRVIAKYDLPFDPKYGLGKTRDELLKEGYLISDIPEPTLVVGKEAIMYYNPNNETVYYEYEDIPLTDSQRIEMLEKAFNDFIIMTAKNK